jgi:chaperonin GroES
MNVNASGMDLRNGIMPLPFGEPSGTLFSLLTFLVNAGERVSATTDMQVGENPGQNQKAETTRTVQENGMKVFTAIYKRIRKALEEELYKLFLLNKRYVDTKEYFTVVAPNGRDMQTLDISYTDYQTADVSVVPSADPHLASPEQKMGRAQYLAGMLQLGGFNEYEVKKRMLEAGNIERIEEVLPDPKGENAIEPPPNPDLLKIQLEMQKEQNAEKERAFRREFDMQELRVRAIEAQAKHAIAQQNANTHATKTHGDIAHKTAELALNHMNSQEEATPSAATQ